MAGIADSRSASVLSLATSTLSTGRGTAIAPGAKVDLLETHAGRGRHVELGQWDQVVVLRQGLDDVIEYHFAVDHYVVRFVSCARIANT